MNVSIASYIKNLIENCYEEDYNPYYANTWRDNYCYQYTFVQWYFLYRKKHNLKKHYKHTPVKLIICSNICN